jgi:hypothetical protein
MTLTQKQYEIGLNPEGKAWMCMTEEEKAVINMPAKIQLLTSHGVWMGAVALDRKLDGITYRIHPDTPYVSDTVTDVKGLAIRYKDDGDVQLIIGSGKNQRQLSFTYLKEILNAEDQFNDLAELNKPRAVEAKKPDPRFASFMLPSGVMLVARRQKGCEGCYFKEAGDCTRWQLEPELQASLSCVERIWIEEKKEGKG